MTKETTYKKQQRVIVRLRSAMVYAMDDCDLALRSMRGSAPQGEALTYVTAARTALKTALETP